MWIYSYYGDIYLITISKRVSRTGSQPALSIVPPPFKCSNTTFRSMKYWRKWMPVFPLPRWSRRLASLQLGVTDDFPRVASFTKRYEWHIWNVYADFVVGSGGCYLFCFAIYYCYYFDVLCLLLATRYSYVIFSARSDLFFSLVRSAWNAWVFSRGVRVL